MKIILNLEIITVFYIFWVIDYIMQKKKLLFWLKFFSSLLILTLLFLNFNLNNFMSLLLTSELLLILIFYIFIFNALLFNLHWIFGFSFIIIILGGLEIALSFLLLNL